MEWGQRLRGRRMVALLLVPLIVLLSGCITGFSPKGGTVAGGTRVTITGTHFAGATAVKFGTTTAASFQVTSSTQITAVTKAHAPGTVEVSVTTPTGVSSDGNFMFEAPPTLSGLSPPDGTTLGGTAVTLTGTHFTGTTAVKFGAATAARFTITSPTAVTATTPAHPAGTVSVQISTYGGTATAPTDYQYKAKLLSITPAKLTNGKVGALYSSKLTVSGGTGTYAWTVTTLPHGLSFSVTSATSSVCVIAGTPTTPGTYTFRIKVSALNGASLTTSRTLNLRNQLTQNATVWPRASTDATAQMAAGAVQGAGTGVLVNTGRYLAVRFPTVVIPKGATIRSAKWELYVTTPGSKIGASAYAELAANPGATGTGTHAISSLTGTVHTVTWASTALTTNAMNTPPTLAAVIQELVTQATWASGNAMLLVLHANTAAKTAHFDAFVNTPTYPTIYRTYAKCSRLVITFSVATSWTGTVAAPNDVATEIGPTPHTVTLGTASANPVFKGTTGGLPTSTPTNQWAIGLRFVNCTIPKSATIKSAYLRVVDRVAAGTNKAHFNVWSLNSANVPVFTATSATVSSRSLITTTHYLWTKTLAPQGALSEFAYSITIKAVVQAVVNLPTWASGNALGLVMKQNTTATSIADYGSTGPVLIVTYAPSV